MPLLINVEFHVENVLMFLVDHGSNPDWGNITAEGFNIILFKIGDILAFLKSNLRIRLTFNADQDNTT